MTPHVRSSRRSPSGRLADDPALAARRELFERLVEEATRQKLIGDVTQAGPSYTIPVAVHIVHMGGIENISDQQVLSQIHALNRDFADSLGNGGPALNTQISFCLAQNLPSASSVTWSCAWTRTATAWRTRPQRTGSSSARAALAGPGALQVDLAGLPRGLYFLRLVTEDGAAARRVTVIR